MQQTEKQSATTPSPFSWLHPRKGGFATFGDLLVLILLFVVSATAASLVVHWLGYPMPEPAEEGIPYPADWDFITFLNYALQMAFMLLLTLLYRRFRGGEAPLARFSARGLNPALLLGGVVVMLALSVVIEPLLGLVDVEQLPMPEPGKGGWTLLSVVVLAPLCEELLCRGILLEGLRSRYGITAALIGSSLFFALIHLHPVMVVNAFVLGLVFGIFTLRTHSLWPAILLHAFNNAVALLLTWAEFPGERFDGRPMADLGLGEMIGNPVIYSIVYGVALLICLRAAVVNLRLLHRISSGRPLKTTNEAPIEPPKIEKEGAE